MSKGTENNSLNQKQEAYCKEYQIDNNQTQAAIRAGYSERSANQVASRLMLNVNIQLKIQELRAKRDGKIEITVDRIESELANIAFFDPAELYDDTGKEIPVHLLPENVRKAISSVINKITKVKETDFDEKTLSIFDDETKEKLFKPNTKIIIRLYDKLKGLELLGRKRGMYVTKVILDDVRDEFDGVDPEKYVTDEIAEND